MPDVKELLFKVGRWCLFGFSSTLVGCVSWTDNFSTNLAKFLKVITTTERLSRDSFSIDALITLSAMLPQTSLTVPDPRSAFSEGSLKGLQHSRRTSSVDSLSKMPSQPIIMKSWKLSCSLKCVISGVAITTFGFPPNCSTFACASPNVRETESLPGKTLIGPRS